MIYCERCTTNLRLQMIWNAQHQVCRGWYCTACHAFYPAIGRECGLNPFVNSVQSTDIQSPESANLESYKQPGESP